MTNGQLPFHKLADVLPLINGKEFAELVASIKANGLRDPITLFEGAILDGRNRYRACLEAGVEPRTEKFNGGDPVLFVLDHNLHRRHLTAGQRAMAMEKYATLAHGDNQWTVDRPMGLSTKNDQATVGKLAGVSGGAVKDARTVRTRGTPEEIADVTSGKAGVRTTAEKIRRRIGPVGRRGMRSKTKLKVFQRFLTLFCNHVENLEEVPIPKLDDAQRKESVLRIKESMRLILKFRKQVEQGGKDA